MSARTLGWCILAFGAVLTGIFLAAVWTGGGTVSDHLAQTGGVLICAPGLTAVVVALLWEED